MIMSKKIRNIVIIFLCVFAVIYILTANHFGRKRTKQEILKFDNSEIDGVVEDVYIKHHGVAFKIIGEDEEFVFYPNTSELNDNKIFNHLAKRGDSVFKSQNSDTLILITNGKKYKYTFQRFDNE